MHASVRGMQSLARLVVTGSACKGTRSVWPTSHSILTDLGVTVPSGRRPSTIKWDTGAIPIPQSCGAKAEKTATDQTTKRAVKKIYVQGWQRGLQQDDSRRITIDAIPDTNIVLIPNRRRSTLHVNLPIQNAFGPFESRLGRYQLSSHSLYYRWPVDRSVTPCNTSNLLVIFLVSTDITYTKVNHFRLINCLHLGWGQFWLSFPDPVERPRKKWWPTSGIEPGHSCMEVVRGTHHDITRCCQGIRWRYPNRSDDWKDNTTIDKRINFGCVALKMVWNR